MYLFSQIQVTVLQVSAAELAAHIFVVTGRCCHYSKPVAVMIKLLPDGDK